MYEKITAEQKRARDSLKDVRFFCYEGFSIVIVTTLKEAKM